MTRRLLALSLLSACAPAGPGLVATAPATAPPTTSSTTTPTTVVATTTTSGRGQGEGVKGGWWARLRECESGSDYRADTGNGYFGAYQFSTTTWRAVGGSGNPAHASPGEQDMRAEMLLAVAGAGQWPVCGRRG